MTRSTLIALLCSLTLACGGAEDKPATPPAKTAPGIAKLTLSQDPGEALSVAKARDAKANDEVIVVGRISNIVKGYASFNLIDTALDYCGSGSDAMELCATPWDYCCIANDEKAENTVVVEAHGADGKVVATPEVPGLRLLDLVAVKGKLQKDEHGNVTVLASGWFRRERPTLRDGLTWPE